MVCQPNSGLGLEDGHHINSMHVAFVFRLFGRRQKTFIALRGKIGNTRLRGFASLGIHESLSHIVREGVCHRLKNLIQNCCRSAVLHAVILAQTNAVAMLFWSLVIKVSLDVGAWILELLSQKRCSPIYPVFSEAHLRSTAFGGPFPRCGLLLSGPR